MTASWSTPPPRCTCSHGPSTHTGGHGRCWQTPCCCESYADAADVTEAIERHPAGKATS